MQLEKAFVVDTTQVADYVDSKEDLLIQIVRTHQHNINSTMLQTARRLRRELQRGTRQIKERTAEKKKICRGKTMHGQFPRNLDEELMDNEQLYRWLKFGDIKGETGSTIVTAKDQAVSMNCFKNEFFFNP